MPVADNFNKFFNLIAIPKVFEGEIPETRQNPEDFAL
jgi:hypothetical protein